MPKSVLSVSELIAVIEHSSLPTLLGEGRDDLILLRRLEEEFSDVGLSVLQSGGRENVLALHALRNSISNRKPLLFLADLDTWMYGDIPAEHYSDLICYTDGYSIENDLYRDGDLERLLLPGERHTFRCELHRFVHWYALALARHLSGQTAEISTHPNELLDDVERYASLCELRSTEVYPSELRDRILQSYTQLIRGKSLLSILLRQLSASHRKPKYSAASLLEIGSTAGRTYVARITAWLSERLR